MMHADGAGTVLLFPDNHYFNIIFIMRLNERALKVALVVGTAVTLINQGDRLITGMAPKPQPPDAKEIKRSRLPFREAAQWRSRGNGTTRIRQGGVPDRMDIAGERRQPEIIGGQPRIRLSRPGPQATE